MKRFIAVLFLSTYFFSTTELGQLLKVPVFITHFIEHKHGDASTTLWEFLSHHYGGHDKDADWDTDMKLPFMQHSDVLTIVVSPPGATIFLDKVIIPFYADKKFVFYRDKFISAARLNSIWQPPQFC